MKCNTHNSRHDSDGFLTITGRIKELIITAGGENISPVAIEDNIRNELPDIVSNVMAVGDRRKHLTCLVTLRAEVDEATAQPTDRLDPAAVAWCEAQGVSGLVRPWHFHYGWVQFECLNIRVMDLWFNTRTLNVPACGRFGTLRIKLDYIPGFRVK